MKKQVDIDILNNFRFMLDVEGSRENLIKYYDKYILEVNKQNITNLKKEVYALMIAYKGKNKEKNKKYYHLYDQLKNGLDYNKAVEIFNNI